jgi:hypothetical protein
MKTITKAEGVNEEDENYHIPPHILLIRVMMVVPSV